MPDRLTSESVIEVFNDQQRFTPSAEEIYSAVFEGKQLIQGIPVNGGEFSSLGLEFSRSVADPVVVLDAAANPGNPEISCRLVARSQNTDADVAMADGHHLDYAVGHGKWLPLPCGTLDEASRFLEEAGILGFGAVTLAQYMKILRLPSPALTVEDRTQNTLQASAIAPRLPGELPASFKGTLYSYQLDGYRWLSFMNKGGLGCIIADEMGLGKTVQVICLLIEAVEAGSRPNLILAPATLLENWRRELMRFGPSLDVLVHAGSHRTGLWTELGKHDIVIASFETAVGDVSQLRKIQ